MTSQNELVVPNPNLIVSGADDDDAEVVTETKIIGVTETGVIRKRSFKRKLTIEEKSRRNFGRDKVDYAKMAENIMAEKIFAGTVEGLQERWKMLGFMHTDCMEMVDQWMKRREELKHVRRTKDADSVIVLVIMFMVFLGICWLVKSVIW